MKNLVYIVEDEDDIADLVSVHLKKNHFDYEIFPEAKKFLNAIETRIPDLIILDLMLPDMDGFDVCKHLKANDKFKNILVIMLTARMEETDKIIGLEIGADDYITKPFSPRELIARVKAVMRRTGEKFENEKQNPIHNSNIININNTIFIDKLKYIVYDSNHNEIALTTTEFKLLLILSEKRGWVFSRDKLLREIWGEDRFVIDRTIDVHIKHLRSKLKDIGNCIKNVRGVGYKLED